MATRAAAFLEVRQVRLWELQSKNKQHTCCTYCQRFANTCWHSWPRWISLVCEHVASHFVPGLSSFVFLSVWWSPHLDLDVNVNRTCWFGDGGWAGRLKPENCGKAFERYDGVASQSQPTRGEDAGKYLKSFRFSVVDGSAKPSTTSFTSSISIFGRCWEVPLR